MKINWKIVAASPGYKSLKAAMVRDIQSSAKTEQKGRHPMRRKAEFTILFNWVIARAKHYAEFRGVTLCTILNEWEGKRDYWWLSYYQESRQPKLTRSPNLKPGGLNAIFSYYKRTHMSNKRRTGKCQEEIKRLARRKRTKKAKSTSGTISQAIYVRKMLANKRAKNARKKRNL